MSKIERALLSVTDKTGVVEFARELAQIGVELISTGGTAKTLREAGIAVKDISELTGFPEMLDGRVKTLHPKVHGGILHIRGNPDHLAAVREHGIQPIDMVVVNLYAFEKTAAKPGARFEEVIENIDIGGPSMVRSAAKNFHDVAIVTAPGDYQEILGEMRANGGSLSLATRWRLAQKAFSTTAAYDAAIASALERVPPPAANGSFDADKLSADSGFPQTPSTCDMAKILTRRRLFTVTGRGREWPTENNSRAKSFPITTLSTCKRPGSWHRNSKSRSAPLSSTRTPAAPQPARRWRKPTGGPWNAIRFPLLAG